jgi:hypothetical protein
MGIPASHTHSGMPEVDSDIAKGLGVVTLKPHMNFTVFSPYITLLQMMIIVKFFCDFG